MKRSLAYSIRRRAHKKKSVREFCIKHKGFWHWCYKRHTGFWVYSNTQGRLLGLNAPQSLSRGLKTHSQILRHRRTVRNAKK